MRFCDFFIEYKLGLKEIKNTIPYTKLPLPRKIVIVVLFVIGVIELILLILQNEKWAAITMVIFFLLLLIFTIIDSSKKNTRYMLENYYKIYSQKRMNMVILILNSYKIKITDTNSIDLLISEAKTAQIEYDSFLALKKPFKVLSAIIVPIVVYVARQIADAASVGDLLNMTLQIIFIIICVFSITIAIAPVIKDITYRDFNKYNELIDDLNQVKIFYSKDTVDIVLDNQSVESFK